MHVGFESFSPSFGDGYLDDSLLSHHDRDDDDYSDDYSPINNPYIVRRHHHHVSPHVSNSPSSTSSSSYTTSASRPVPFVRRLTYDGVDSSSHPNMLASSLPTPSIAIPIPIPDNNRTHHQEEANTAHAPPQTQTYAHVQATYDTAASGRATVSALSALPPLSRSAPLPVSPTAGREHIITTTSFADLANESNSSISGHASPSPSPTPTPRLPSPSMSPIPIAISPLPLVAPQHAQGPVTPTYALIDFATTTTPPNPLTIDDLLVHPPPEWALCTICFEVFKRPSITRCGHTFCHPCIVKLTQSGSATSSHCPLCRKRIEGLADISSNYQMKQVISGMLVRCKNGFEAGPAPPEEDTGQDNDDEASFVYLSPSSSTTTLPDHFVQSTSASSSSSLMSSSSSLSPSSPHPTPLVWRPSPNGCQAIFEYGTRSSHEASCGHVVVSCYNEGCRERVKRKDRDAHMAQCPYRATRCLLCRETVQHFAQEKHGQECPEKTVYCPLNCGDTYLRREAAQHQAVCPVAVTPCPHAPFGCRVSSRRDALSKHLPSCPYEGIKDYLLHTQQQMQHLMQVTRSQHQEIRVLQTALAAQGMELTMLKRNMQGASSPTTQTDQARHIPIPVPHLTTATSATPTTTTTTGDPAPSLGSSLRARLESFARGAQSARPVFSPYNPAQHEDDANETS
eukprot:TRINITY_DN3224_c0_g1_i2.p1 TRINITY_DN3224_c0_g1~~TRINITY_DN3224_c0_g1_i2.p1  ORF type:complete len:681 (+),score=156.72 TRINITY_DN3224_c0_g1_i2:164-2206(+)